MREQGSILMHIRFDSGRAAFAAARTFWYGTMINSSFLFTIAFLERVGSSLFARTRSSDLMVVENTHRKTPRLAQRSSTKSRPFVKP